MMMKDEEIEELSGTVKALIESYNQARGYDAKFILLIFDDGVSVGRTNVTDRGMAKRMAQEYIDVLDKKVQSFKVKDVKVH